MNDETPSAPAPVPPVGTSTPMSPGDEAPPGTPGTGEALCPDCAGKARADDGSPCPTCGGTGRVVAGIGGA